MESRRASARDPDRPVGESRRWRLVATGAIGALALCLLGGAAMRLAGPVEAGEFVLRDEQGGMRASLTMRPDGTPGLGLFDEAGGVRLSLDLARDGSPGINVCDAGGTLRSALAFRPDGTPGLGLFDEKGQDRRTVEIEADVDRPTAMIH